MGIGGKIDYSGVHAYPSLPAGDGGGVGADGVGIEILDQRQCVEQAAKGAEGHDGRPVGGVAAALGPHIYVVLCVGRKSGEQEAVGAHVGDDGG